MPEYECAVAKVHKRLYGAPQQQPPVCCGKPMVLTQVLPIASASAQPKPGAGDPQALWTHEVATVPQKKRSWWQLWD
jgi:hypothetical protein